MHRHSRFAPRQNNTMVNSQFVLKMFLYPWFMFILHTPEPYIKIIIRGALSKEQQISVSLTDTFLEAG